MAAPARPGGLTLAPRLFFPQALVAHDIVTLPESAARHVRVLRLQPGAAIALFNGVDGAEWPGEIVRIGRRDVEVRVGAAPAAVVDRELACEVTLAFGVPANDRMDALVEKAGELGATAIQPLLCERSVVRVAGDRAEAKRAHWQAVAAAASEQCGRTRVAALRPVVALAAWLESLGTSAPARRVVLSLASTALAPERAFSVDSSSRVGRDSSGRESIVVLSGPEGGLTADEEDAAIAAGFVRVALGPRILRADTAPLALLAWLGLRSLAANRASR